MIPGVATLVALCLVPAVLWAVAAPLGPRFDGATAALASVAVIAAVVGTCSFAFNLVLGARLRSMDALFGGLDRLFRIHRVNGRLAYLLLLAHVVLILSSAATASVQSALDMVTLRAGWTIGLGVVAFAAMTAAIVITLYARTNHELFVYSHRAFGFIFLLASLHVFRTPGTKAVSPALTWYLAAVSAVGLAAFAYRSVLGSRLVRRHSYRVQRVRHFDQSVTEITMTPIDGRMPYTPGQFVFVSFVSEALREHFHPVSVEVDGQIAHVDLRTGALGEQSHPFSITSAPDERELRVAIKALGDFTRAVRVLEEGAIARVEGPYGGFSYLSIPNNKQVWIAGGIGVTPFLSMARSLASDEFEIDFYYAMETGDQGYFLDELYDIADRHPRLRVIPIKKDKLGHLSVDDISGVSGDIAAKDILICGPPPMIDALRSQFLAKGVANSRIHFEKFALRG